MDAPVVPGILLRFTSLRLEHVRVGIVSSNRCNTWLVFSGTLDPIRFCWSHGHSSFAEMATRLQCHVSSHRFVVDNSYRLSGRGLLSALAGWWLKGTALVDILRHLTNGSFAHVASQVYSVLHPPSHYNCMCSPNCQAPWNSIRRRTLSKPHLAAQEHDGMPLNLALHSTK